MATEESHSVAPKRTPSQAEEQPDPKRPRSAPAQASASRQQAPPRATTPVIAPGPTPAPAGRTPFAAAAAKGPAPQANVAPQLDMSVEPHSGIRVRPATRKLSRDDVNSIAKQFAVRKIADLPQHFRGATAATAQVDWVTIGVLAKKKASKTSESGRTFHVWEISDLRPGSAAKSIPSRTARLSVASPARRACRPPCAVRPSSVNVRICPTRGFAPYRDAGLIAAVSAGSIAGRRPRSGAVRRMISAATGTAVQPAVRRGSEPEVSTGSSSVTTST